MRENFSYIFSWSKNFEKSFFPDLPEPAIYRSFDTKGGLTLMEGDIVGNFSALVPGKANEINYSF